MSYSSIQYDPCSESKIIGPMLVSVFIIMIETVLQKWSENKDQVSALFEDNRATGVLIDEPKFGTSIRQDFEPMGEIFYFRAHGRNAKAWWNPKESWKQYHYCYTRDVVRSMTTVVICNAAGQYADTKSSRRLARRCSISSRDRNLSLQY
jgi:hypothetical protein